MNRKSLLFALFGWLLSLYPLSAVGKHAANAVELKPRILILTDIAPSDVEPDDMESMIRLLAHADLFEIEGLVTSTGWNTSNYPEAWAKILQQVIDAYEKDVANLMRRSEQTSFLPLDREQEKQALGYWPSAGYLRSRSVMGSTKMGYRVLGTDNHSAGSELIIRLADEDDARPLWILAWGGANTLAQAIWKVRQERSEEQINEFLHKLCLYTITDQDVGWGERHSNYPFSSHQWMRKVAGKEMLFIWDESAWLSQNSLGSIHWAEYAEQIQGHGSMGAIYPKYKYGVEGDTPSFLHVLPNGLNDPTQPGQGGWGGYFVWETGMDKAAHVWTNSNDSIKKISQRYEGYFYPAVFNNFAARMEWAKTGKGNRNPIVTVNGHQGMEILTLDSKPGKTVTLDASKSTDPDRDALTFRWWIYPEAGTYKGTVALTGENTARATIKMPTDAAGKTIHVVCEVTDNGTPRLTNYRRVILRLP
ncbi:MAG: DUF1593 domain-containing protein [Prevotellaceae bacterium]|jgi:hypothetical protein|nr:DUF1593 domain-containing protein [Prevotellaceae bacterium]